jgi:hypothetical protein
MAAFIAIALAVAVLVDPPAGSPPKVGGTMGVGPPPAWIDDGRRSRWLAYGSYCWRAMCVDMVAPESRPDLPRIDVRRGQLLRVHLTFAPVSASVQVVRGERTLTLAWTGRRTLTFRAQTGILMVGVTSSGGAPSYLARLY